MKGNAREKKILYSGIAIAIVIIIYYAATELLPGDGGSLADKVEMQESLLVKQRELVGYREYYEGRINDAENDIEKIQTLLLPVSSSGAAFTELRRILTDFAAMSGVVITATSNQPEKKVENSDSLIKISVQIQVNCSLEDLVDFLSAINNYDKFLKVEDITINTRTENNRQMVITRPLRLVIAGYINVPPQSEAD